MAKKLTSAQVKSLMDQVITTVNQSPAPYSKGEAVQLLEELRDREILRVVTEEARPVKKSPVQEAAERGFNQ